jgi:hypothetical protein
MMSSSRQDDGVAQEVGSWPGVSASDNGRGGTTFMVGQVELGHLHGNRLAHLPFPRRVQAELLAAGRVTPHPVLPASGWSERRIAGPADADDVIGLFRLNYDRVRARQVVRSGHGTVGERA